MKNVCFNNLYNKICSVRLNKRSRQAFFGFGSYPRNLRSPRPFFLIQLYTASKCTNANRALAVLSLPVIIATLAVI